MKRFIRLTQKTNFQSFSHVQINWNRKKNKYKKHKNEQRNKSNFFSILKSNYMYDY